MEFVRQFFKKYKPVEEKLLKYGFVCLNNIFVKEFLFMNNQFRAVIKISSIGEISSNVIEVENEEEFLPLRIKDIQSGFVAEVRYELEKLLEKIRENCFIRQYYVNEQSNRITELIRLKYGDTPEFLWKDYPNSGIFRNPISGKWYCAILDVDMSRLIPDKKGYTEVLNLKLEPNHVLDVIKKPYFYEAYHMNKKHWISIILNNNVSDDEIMDLITISHGFTDKKPKSKNEKK